MAERPPTVTIREIRIDWSPGDRWPVGWRVELVSDREVFRVSGRLTVRRPGIPRVLRRSSDVAILPDRLCRYRRDWTRWVDLVPSRYPDVLQAAIREIRAQVDARYTREAA